MTKVIIVDVGSGGISVGSRLLNSSEKFEVLIIDPSSYDFYQPLWTLVGGEFRLKFQARH